jgi:hypothetical protein
MSAFNVIIFVGFAYISLKVFQIWRSKKSELKTANKDVSFSNVSKETFKSASNPTPKENNNTMDLSASAFGGRPLFFNEADCSRGRFLGWARTDIDRADKRKVENGLYRARITQDVKYFWFFPGVKEVMTPCVFRPNIDAVSYNPGQMEGVPPEGMIVFKRSFDGQRLAIGTGERYRSLLLDEQHKNSILLDMLINIKDKERLMGLEDSSKESTDEMERRLKRTKKLHDAAQGRGMNDGLGFGGNPNPYAGEMYGNEPDDLGAPGGGGSDTLWKFEQ